jgi:uncharacterized protein (DUF58 family)
VLWFLLYPQRGQRTGLTVSGLLVIVVSVGIGTAAYNSASNILFLTLSLLLGCIILSGILSWQNFRGLSWRLEVVPPLRVRQPHPIALVLRNSKLFLPSYGVWFEVKLERSGENKDLVLRRRLDPRSETRLECTVTPHHRGKERIELIYVGSYFPFGFLRKTILIELSEEVVVWPAPIEYRRNAVAAWQRQPTGADLRRIGQGGDLHSLRRYQSSDSHRLIHWKASARLKQLMVKQTAAEAGETFSLWVDLRPELWARPEQFELLCSFAATIAEDLFRTGKLSAVAVGRNPLVPVRGLRDLELFLDRLALASPAEAAAASQERDVPMSPASAPVAWSAGRNVMVFAPDGPRGVAAYVNGERAASA